MIFTHQSMTITLKQIKTTRMSVRRTHADRFIVHGPKTMPARALKKMVIQDFERLLKLPIPFDYDAYLTHQYGHVFGSYGPWNVRTLKHVLMDEIVRLESEFKTSQSKINLDNLVYEIKPYRSKFGSCHPHRRIIRFNQMLVHYPKPYLKAIYAHEIAHLNEPNHQAGFYHLLKSIHPAYPILQKELKTIHQSFLKGAYDRTSIAHPSIHSL
mgnify:FL=1